MEITFIIVAIFFNIAVAIIAYFWSVSRNKRNINAAVMELKLKSYQIIITETHAFLLTIKSMVDETRGTSIVDDELAKRVKEYKGLLDRNDANFFLNIIFLSDSFVKNYMEYSLRAKRFLLGQYNANAAETYKIYLTLTKIHSNLINAARKDLHVKGLKEPIELYFTNQ